MNENCAQSDVLGNRINAAGGVDLRGWNYLRLDASAADGMGLCACSAHCIGLACEQYVGMGDVF